VINANIQFFCMVLTSLRISFTLIPQLVSSEERRLVSLCATMHYGDGENLFGLGPTCEGYKGKR